jgi:hypothetical protein
MIWVDAHISPAVAKWIAAELGHPAQSVRDLGLLNAKDKDIPPLRDALQSHPAFPPQTKGDSYGPPRGAAS